MCKIKFAFDLFTFNICIGKLYHLFGFKLCEVSNYNGWCRCLFGVCCDDWDLTIDLFWFRITDTTIPIGEDKHLNNGTKK